SNLQRPECILAERDGTLWAADARGGVVRLDPDGTQTLVTQNVSDHFDRADRDATRYLQGTLPNGPAFARNGDFLMAKWGSDRLERVPRDGPSEVAADQGGGREAGSVNFGLRDPKDRIWVTVSPRVKNWTPPLPTALAEGSAARSENRRLHSVADAFR